MSSDLPDRLLGLSIDEPSEQRTDDSEDSDDETYERFLMVYVGDHRLALPVYEVKAITDKPVTMTRIPRSGQAIEGVTDLRGEITVIIDPHVHFPDAGERAVEPALLVLDRPSEQQAAAIIADDVLGVETVPEDDILDETVFTADEIDGSVLEHPLVTGIVKIERHSRPMVHETVPMDTTATESGSGEQSTAALELDSLDRGSRDDSEDTADVVVDEFSLSEEDGPDSSGERSESTKTETVVEVEATPVVDIDRLLLASGRTTENELEER